ncbi:Ppx/GppA phosphatase family protein [Arundinibacter roseus]|uniref:Phosphatase n=1 Tax=Arundinibacter roseus TaxID=2070510 RepID=A0A4R4KDB8_9BACT|nr:phosphatase [Arundinibacter roseus]TDB65860.1 phosphatase [Arundinibacter roseus]
MTDRLGIIDLGTNTFHLLIVEKRADGGSTTLFHESRAAKIGEGGINRQTITEAATERALTVLRFFRQKLEEFDVELTRTFAFGTSAIRNADNGEQFCQLVEKETGIHIQQIDGNQEALLIYEGVRNALDLGTEPSLIMDIGGGSVEFILGNQQQIFWKQSFEIGGQRLMEKFMRTDPLTNSDRQRLYNYFDEQLIPLANAIHQYAPTALVGSSGTFDTLVAMDYQHRLGEWPAATETGFDLSLEEFYRSFELLLTRNAAERLTIPGMIPLRVNMIVVAVCLIDYVLKKYKIPHLRVSSYALKEGALAHVLKDF